MSQNPGDPHDAAGISAGPTRWSLVIAAADEDAGKAGAAMEALASQYLMPLYAYVRRNVEHKEDAEDILQDFFAEKLVGGNLLRCAEEQKGSFRGLLRKAMDNCITDWRRHANAARRDIRRVIALPELAEDYYTEMVASELPPDMVWDYAWASDLLHQSIEILERAAGGDEDMLMLRLLRSEIGPPEEAVTRAEVVARLGLASNTVSQKLHRLRETLLGVMRSELRELCRSQREFQEEWACLLSLLGQEPNDTA